MDSLAILERGYLYPSPASATGVKSDCPFCIARHVDDYRAGDLAVMLHMLDAGRVLRYSTSESTEKVDQFEWVDEPGPQLRLMRQHWLTLPLELLTVPFWLPGLSLRNCFIIDELAVWFCSESAVGVGFHWEDERIIELARTCWEKRLPVKPSEISKVLLAHGMPTQYQSKAEHLFQFGMATLISSKGRKPMKKLREDKRADRLLFEIWETK